MRSGGQGRSNSYHSVQLCRSCKEAGPAKTVDAAVDCYLLKRCVGARGDTKCV